MTDRKKEIAFFERLSHELAADAVEKMPEEPTAEEREVIERMGEHADALLRQKREELRKQAAAEVDAETRAPIPQRILEMTRDAILARLRQLQELATPERPIAVHARKLEALSLHDLQWLLATIEADISQDDAGA